MFKVYTFGLKVTFQGENRLETLKRFISTHKITMVYDIRYDRGNYYRNWNCNGDNIAKMIKKKFDYNCGYFTAPKLGIPGDIRLKYKSIPFMMEFLYINQVYREKLDRVFEFESNEERVLLLCIENLKDPKSPYCHRIWLRNYLVGSKLAELGEVME